MKRDLTSREALKQNLIMVGECDDDHKQRIINMFLMLYFKEKEYFDGGGYGGKNRTQAHR